MTKRLIKTFKIQKELTLHLNDPKNKTNKLLCSIGEHFYLNVPISV